MSLTWIRMSERTRCAARIRASSPFASRNSVKRLQRELGVDHEPARVAGQVHEAVRPGAVRERRLEGVGARRQPVADDRLHPALAVGAAGLLVGEDLAQADDLAGEVREVPLRGVDHGETLVELGEVLALMAGGRLESLADAVLEAVDALSDHAGELALPRAEDLRDGLQPSRHLGLDPGQLRDLVVHLARPLGRRGGIERALAAGSHEENGDRHEEQEATGPQSRGRPRPR